ncbi:MAG: hypothetical protein ACOCV2_04390 [Persicimonas sp.]
MTEQPRRTADSLSRAGLLAACILALAALHIPASAFADEMDFGVDEVQEDDEEGEEGEDGDDGDDEDGEDDDVMDFGAEETSEEDAGDSDSYSVAVVAVPSSDLSDKERKQLEDQMTAGVDLDPDYQAEDGGPVLEGLEEAGLASCVTEPLCLSNVGQDAGVDRILLGSVEREGGSYTLNIDLFDVSEKLFAKYAEADRLSDFKAVEEAVEPTMKDIFDMRVERDGPDYGSEADRSVVQRVIAWTAAGAAVGSLGAGIYFGMDASSQQSDLENETESNDEFTQTEAYSRQQDAQRAAVTANILYGSAAALGIVSGVLFYVEAGSDVGESDQRADGRLQLKPSIGFGKVGLDAAIRF